MSWIIIVILLSIIVSTYQLFTETIDDSTEENDALRAKFLDDKKRNNITAKRIKFLEKYAVNDSVLVDDILHYKISGHPQLKQVNQIEEEFRNMIAMDGVTYIFNRDMAWRTWRKVLFDKKARIVHYKYATSTNCTKNCDNGGYWMIEKHPPPCALEIFSIDTNSVCALNMKHYHLKTLKCSSYLFSLLTTNCDNPIVTTWVVQKTFSKKGKKQRFPDVICGGREFCRILTVYKINADHVSFKIINTTNHIIYSRIMKSTGDNYACTFDCGVYDRKTNTVIKQEKPLKLNLLNKKIQKRDKLHEDFDKEMENVDEVTRKSFIKSYFDSLKSTTHSPSCRNMQHDHDLEDDIVDEGLDSNNSPQN